MVVAYVGPIRTLDAAILGESVYVAIHPSDLGLTGPIPPDAGREALLFVARPWAFGAPRVRAAIERASFEPAKDGWRAAGDLDQPDGSRRFTLELNRKSEPRSLRVELGSSDRRAVTVRYGPARRFKTGRVPQWIEWTHGATRIRLSIDENAPAKPSQLRHPPRAGEGWTIVALDDPRGRDVLRRLLGVGDEEGP